ncbi:trypsin Inhibitor like cysteine rich domain protein [Trichuris suis]|nr:trypsin Inhibitor like cysteine rich domain protein [Trichuris suis]
MRETSAEAEHMLKTKCGPNQVYLRCGPSCPLTCEDVLRPKPKMCTLQCVRGCFCKGGYVLDEEKNCVPRRRCLKSRKRQPGLKEKAKTIAI